MLSIDTPGFGNARNPTSKFVYVQKDHRISTWSLHVRKSLLKQQLEDVLFAWAYVRRYPPINTGDLYLIDIGTTLPVTAHPRIIATQHASVSLRNSVGSWIDATILNPEDTGTLNHVVPASLSKYDLPDLAAILDKKLTFE